MFDAKGYVERAATTLFGSCVLLAKVDASDASYVAISKLDGDEQLVFGEVYAPGYPDSQGDFMSAETVRKAAYDFMKRSQMGNIDTNHDEQHNGSFVVESFIARKGDDTFIPGSWVIGVKVADDKWPLVKSGEINGFSLDGMAIRTPTKIELEIPHILKGETSVTDDHSHVFFVKYDDAGRFLGGQTSHARDGHFHLIKAGTVTEPSQGHSHRFSAVDAIIGQNTSE